LPLLRPPPRAALFPYTTLFRSLGVPAHHVQQLQCSVGWPADVRFPRLDGSSADVEQPREHGLRDTKLRTEGDDVFRLHLRGNVRSEEQTSELQSLRHLVCRLLL